MIYSTATTRAANQLVAETAAKINTYILGELHLTSDVYALMSLPSNVQTVAHFRIPFSTLHSVKYLFNKHVRPLKQNNWHVSGPVVRTVGKQQFYEFFLGAPFSAAVA